MEGGRDCRAAAAAAAASAAAGHSFCVFALFAGRNKRPCRFLFFLLIVTFLVVLGAGLCHRALCGLCGRDCVSEKCQGETTSCLSKQNLKHLFPTHKTIHTNTGKQRWKRCLTSDSGVWRTCCCFDLVKTGVRASPSTSSFYRRSLPHRRCNQRASQSGGQRAVPEAGTRGGASGEAASQSLQS